MLKRFQKGPEMLGQSRMMPTSVDQQLADLCLAETIRTGGDGHDFQDRLGQAYDIIYNSWSFVTPDALQGWGRRSAEPPTEDDLKQRREAKRVLWQRKDPMRSYQDGFESPSYVNFNRDELIEEVAAYLARPWLRHPFLDWAFVDMLITRELCVWGEEVKQRHLPGPRDMLGSFHRDYFSSQGKLSELTKTDWKGRLQFWFCYAAIGIAAPVAAICTAFVYGWTTTGWWLLGTYALLVIVEVVSIAWQLLKRAIRVARGLPTKPENKSVKLWGSMYQVWRLLSGPVVNPTLVREELAKTSELGAGWDNTVWSLVDRVIRQDPAVWVVTPQR